MQAKARIFANQTGADAMVINADDPNVLEIARQGRARPLCFGLTAPLEEGIVVSDDMVTHRTLAGDRPLLPVSAVRLPGQHLLSDVLAAAAVGTVAGLEPDAMRNAVASFGGLEHTLEDVAVVQGIRFVNDSKATNIVAARASIECFEGDVVVIMGGRFKGGDIQELVPSLHGRAIAVVAIGEARERFQTALGSELPVRVAEDMGDAVRQAYAMARPGGVVLLAPACASLDMFSDYAERGRAFKTEVTRVAEENTT